MTRSHFVPLVPVTLLVSLFLAPIAAASDDDLRVRGVVSDVSGAVLPGVSVTAMSADGASVATTSTNAGGEFTIAGTYVPRLTLAFELDGFASKSIPLAVDRHSEPWESEVLALATRTETVTVVGMVPAAVSAPVLPPPPPPPAVVPVPQHDRDVICGPATPDISGWFGTLRAVVGDETRQLYARGDQLLVDGGTSTGIEVGTNYVVRRTLRVRGTARDQMVEQGAGLVQVVSADERSAVAVIVYACDALSRGDRLTAFAPEPPQAQEAFGEPDFDNAARILYAEAGQQLGAARRLMVIDRGTDSNLHVGQSLTLFRRSGMNGLATSVVGAGAIIAVREHSSTIRIEQGRDALVFGDWAAPQRQPESR